MKYLFLILILLLPTQLGKHWWPEWSLVNGVRVDYLSPTVYMTDILLFLLTVLLLFKTRKIFNFQFSRLRLPFAFRFYSNTAPACRRLERQRLAGRHGALFGGRAIFNQIPNSNFQKLKSEFIFFLLAASYLLFIVWFSPQPWLAGYWLVRYLEIPLVAFLTIKIRRIRGERRTGGEIPIALAIAVLGSVGLGAAQMILGKTTGWFWWLGERTFTAATPGVATLTIFGREVLRPYATFPHPNALGGFLAAGFWLIKEGGRRIRGNRRTRWIINTGKIAAAMGVILTGSRGALAALVVAALLKIPAFASRSPSGTIRSRLPPAGAWSASDWRAGTGRYSAGRQSEKLKVKSLLVILGILGGLGLWGRLGESGGERVILAGAAGKMWRDNWLTGVGPGQFLVKLPEYLTGGFYKIQPVHNIFLLILAEFGIIGLSIIIITIIKIIKSAVGAGGAGLKWAPVLAVIFVTGTVDHYWLTAQQNRLLLGVILGMLISSWRRRSICDCGLRLRNR